VKCKLSLPFLSLRTVNTVTHSYDTSAVLPQWFLFCLHKHMCLVIVFMSVQIFLDFHFQNFFWLDKMFQSSAQTLLNSRFEPNSLKFPVGFPTDILTFVPILCCAVVQILRKFYEHEYSSQCRNVSRHQTSCMLLCSIWLFHAVQTSSGYID